MTSHKDKIKELVSKLSSRGLLTDEIKQKIRDKFKKVEIIPEVEVKGSTVFVNLKEVEEAVTNLGEVNKNFLGEIKDTLINQQADGLEVLIENTKTLDQTFDILRDNIEGQKRAIIKSNEETGTLGRKANKDLATTLFSALSDLLVALSNRVFRVQPTAEAFTTPQYVVFYDPVTKSIIRPQEMWSRMAVTVAGGSGGSSTQESTIATGLGVGNKDVAVAGTAEQLSSVAIKKVTIRAKQTNTDYVFVGDSSVDSSNGVFLGPMDSIILNIDNLNLVWINANVNGEGVVFTYES